jgi:hypothetical protein
MMGLSGTTSWPFCTVIRLPSAGVSIPLKTGMKTTLLQERYRIGKTIQAMLRISAARTQFERVRRTASLSTKLLLGKNSTGDQP